MATTACPLNCGHCLAAEQAGVRDMPLRTVASLVEQVAGLGVDEFLLTGGEPLCRPDLPDVIGVLRANGVSWTLNTAVMPDARVRAAIEAWPPAFVAVSIDGPPTVHDAFRGRSGAFDAAIESIVYFSELIPGRVAAGTTVTAVNVESLPITFGVVVESGASMWGLHLLVPEGRAAYRPDLRLSSGQLKHLLRFVAEKRRHFPVTMADEIGYCGLWEPLVRNEPFFCGAGKAQCVVLPDGEVVPCTTMDRSTSAGNVLDRTLWDIWENGFSDLRHWSPTGRCAACRYAAACEGGCWLQRRHGGSHCYREAWHVPEALTTAGMAVCLGLTVLGVPAQAEEPSAPPPVVLMTAEEAAKMQILQKTIIQWYAAELHALWRRASNADAVLDGLKRSLPDDPGARFFIGYVRGEKPERLSDLKSAISDAFRTEQRSLCLVGLTWRSVAEWCLEGRHPADRPPSEKRVLRETLKEMAGVADAWQDQILKNKLDPFLRRPLDYRRFLLTKACTLRPRTPGDAVALDLAVKRGYTNERGRHLPTLHLQRLCPYGRSMMLPFRSENADRVKVVRRGKEMAIDGRLDVFDILVVPDREDVALLFEWNEANIRVALPVGSELTYADTLRLAHEQNAEAFGNFSVSDRSSRAGLPLSPLLIPELRRRIERSEENRPAQYSREMELTKWALTGLYVF